MPLIHLHVLEGKERYMHSARLGMNNMNNMNNRNSCLPASPDQSPLEADLADWLGDGERLIRRRSGRRAV